MFIVGVLRCGLFEGVTCGGVLGVLGRSSVGGAGTMDGMSGCISGG